jgi:hypothetical protein
MSSGNSRPPSFVLTRLYRKKSEKGNTYFTGRLGGARVVLLKSNDTADDGGEIWNLLASEAQPKRDDAGQRQPKAPPEGNNPAPPATRDWQQPFSDSDIPF